MTKPSRKRDSRVVRGLGGAATVVSVAAVAAGCSSDPPTVIRGEPDAGGAPPAMPEPMVSADAASPDPGPRSEYIFDDDAPVKRFDVRLADEHWESIKAFPILEQYVPATLIFEGKAYGPIGLRFKGFRGSLYNCFDCCSTSDDLADCPEQACYDENGVFDQNPSCDKFSFKLSFEEFGDVDFFGLNRLNFHAGYSDVAFMRQRLAYWMYREFDVPAPRAVHAMLSINGEHMSVYTLVEQVDSVFARFNFEDGEGNVYKERWPTQTLDPEYYRSGLKTNRRGDTDVSGIVSFAEALLTATNETIDDVLRQHVDFDRLMRFLAVNQAIRNWDGITMFRCQPLDDIIPLPNELFQAQLPPLGWEVCQNKNFYWYEDTSGRLTLVPWDTDNALVSPSGSLPNWRSPAQECDELFFQSRAPACDPLIWWLANIEYENFQAAGRELLQGPFEIDRVNLMLDKWTDQISGAVSEEGLSPGGLRLLVANFRGTVLYLRSLFEEQVTETP